MEQTIMTLNPHELIEWCNMRRKEMGISKAKLAEISLVPESTLDRILSGKNPEFRYSTVQPIVAALLQVNEDIPAPDLNDKQQPEYYYNTIEGYKLVLENKNYIIDELNKMLEFRTKEIYFLQEENTKKDMMIHSMQEHLKWMETLIDESSKK